VGRWGNFFNQEAFGTNTDLPWGMMSYKTMYFIADNDYLGGTVSANAPVHPCFLYESLWCILGFVLLHLYMKHRKFDGEIFLMYIGWYGLGRFFIESLRTDSLYLANIKVSQLLAAVCFIAAIILIIVFRGIFRRRGDYKFFYETETSKLQLAKANKYSEIQKDKKDLKNKIKVAKSKGESFAEFEKEYKEKYGKNAVTEELTIDSEENSDAKKDEYKSILDDDNSETDKVEMTEEESSDE
ncbi:MAG: prolipoprotein diacylglyceryl transferase, partial [Ruminococcus sp.]|nr:prolipoprotein diacylglyceryl transferase [Ruminococcus sp.]